PHPRPPSSTLFPYTTLFRSLKALAQTVEAIDAITDRPTQRRRIITLCRGALKCLDPNQEPGKRFAVLAMLARHDDDSASEEVVRSEEHTSELQSRSDLVCRL